MLLMATSQAWNHGPKMMFQTERQLSAAITRLFSKQGYDFSLEDGT